MGNSNDSSHDGHNHQHDHEHQNQTKQQNSHKNHKHSHSHAQNPPPPYDPEKKYMKDSMILAPYGGQVAVDKVNKKFFKKMQIFQFQYQHVQNAIKKRMRLKHPNFITVQNYSFQSLKDNQAYDSRTDIQKSLYFCYPESKILRLQFQPAVLNVNGLIKSYCKKREPMEEHLIRKIMKSVIDCLIYLRQNNTYHGDIKPTTIFIHPKTQQVKLVDSFLLNNGKTSYQIVNQNPKSQSFLTPEQLDKKKNRQADSLQNVYKADVFCFGLTLIEMMTFQASMQAYNLQSLQVKPQFLQRKLVQMQQFGYSYALTDLSLRCIHKEPSKRPDFEQILRVL